MRYCVALLLGIAVCLFCSSPAKAQWWGTYEKWEISPFVGYTTGGSFPIDTSLTVSSLHLNGNVAFGSFVDYSLTENAQVDFMWNRNNTSFNQYNYVAGVSSKAFDSDVDTYSFGLLYMLRNSEKTWRPYIAGGVGFAHEANDLGNPNHTAFSYSIGGGVKYNLSKHFGFRGDVRYMPIRANETEQEYCSYFYGCYPAAVRNYIQRADFTAAFVIKF
jgi:opacity protein-like surface antigen